MSKPLILLTNDDGVHARGLKVLGEGVRDLGEVVVVCPLHEVSACGHQITLHLPLRAMDLSHKEPWPCLAVNGTPADCVKLALLKLLPRRPDLILSGINPGSNLGTDVIYSGTVAAAGEGALLGIPSAAISLDCPRQGVESEDFIKAAEFAARLASRLLSNPLPRGTFLNVNVPFRPDRPLRAVVTSQGVAGYLESYDEIQDPRGRTHYWLAGQMNVEPSPPGSDDEAVRAGLISVTPIRYDLTDRGFLSDLSRWGEIFDGTHDADPGRRAQG